MTASALPIPLFVVDAFASAAFTGNPAAVCLLAEERDQAWMQKVASEMNLSETAFVVARSDGELGLRWFTPAVEVDLCGHATLASAHVLWETARLGRERAARFHTKSGVLVAKIEGDAIALDFPSHPPVAAEAPHAIEDALDARPTWIGRSRFDVLVELASEAEVRALKPDLAALARVEGRGFIVTSRATSPGSEGFDFVSRFFAPRVGVAEDPVTGSAHCALAPYWAERLGKRAMVAYQASARGGVVRVRVEGERTILGGKAITITRGELLA